MTKPKKVAILMAGGSAAGKTSTTQELAVGTPKEFKELKLLPMRKGLCEEKVVWTLYDNCAVAGNHNGGTDANKGPAAHCAAFFECLKISDVAIIDGKINSPQWVEAVNQANDMYNVHLVLLYFNLSGEELLTRLAKRRQMPKESIRDSMYQKCVEATGRADLLVRNTAKLYKYDYKLIEVNEDQSTVNIVELLEDEIEWWLE